VTENYSFMDVLYTELLKSIKAEYKLTDWEMTSLMLSN
jgi:hypothetical protein